MDHHETDWTLTHTIDIVESLSTLSKLDCPGNGHDCEEDMLESIFQEEGIERRSINDRARKVTTKVADDAKTRFKLFTSHLKKFGGIAKTFKFISMQHRSKTMTNETVNTNHEQINSFGSLSITDFLPNDVHIATKMT